MRAAGDNTPTLPEDPVAVRALLLETLARCGTLSAELGSITAERDALAMLDRAGKLDPLLAA